MENLKLNVCVVICVPSIVDAFHVKYTINPSDLCNIITFYY